MQVLAKSLQDITAVDEILVRVVRLKLHRCDNTKKDVTTDNLKNRSLTQQISSSHGGADVLLQG